jgi:hypothetical protein
LLADRSNEAADEIEEEVAVTKDGVGGVVGLEVGGGESVRDA